MNTPESVKRLEKLYQRDKAKYVRDVHKAPKCIDVLEGECPSCNGLVVTDTYVDITRFCRWCGQRLSWGSYEERFNDHERAECL